MENPEKGQISVSSGAGVKTNNNVKFEPVNLNNYVAHTRTRNFLKSQTTLASEGLHGGGVRREWSVVNYAAWIWNCSI